MIQEYLHEIGAFVAGYIWTILILTLGAHRTVQRSVCSLEDVTGGIVSIEACNGYTTVLKRVVGSGETSFHLAALLTGLLLAFVVYALRKE